MSSKARGLADLGNAFDDGALSNRNIIINGAMQVAQRGTSFTTVSDQQYCLDRWNQEHDTATFDLDIEQASGPTEEGFLSSLKATVQTTATLSASGYIIPFEQRIEKTHLDQFCWGTPNAKPITISFWVKSNRTGTCNLDLVLGVATGGTDRTATKQYTINTAGVWEYKTLTFPANTTTYSGQAPIHNGLSLFWWMIAGSTYTSGTTPSGWQPQVAADRAVGCSNSTTVGDYWQITGVQFEVGDTATPFEHRSYGDELARCQRYYQVYRAKAVYNPPLLIGAMRTSTALGCTFTLPTPMRVSPSFTATNSAAAWYVATSTDANANTIVLASSTPNTADLGLTTTTGIAGQAARVYPVLASGYFDFDAEI
jgi:hypothetical protein